MASTTVAPVNRSWAQLVQGDSKKVESTQKTVKPARRGSLLRLCRGEVLQMLANYGWLMLYGDVDDPSIEKHGGDVYIHKDDIVDGETLCAGDIVSFYLYSDDKGLGAEMCTVEQKAASRYSMNANAKEFVPADSDLDIINIDNVANVFLRVSRVFASDSEDESDDSDDEWSSVETLKAKRAPSSDGSTYGGATSDSEEEDTSCGDFSDSETEWSSVVQWRPPPGLSLPSVGFSAPPGLAPPGFEDIGVFSSSNAS